MTPAYPLELVSELQRKRAEVQATLTSLEASSQPVELDQAVQGRLSRLDAIGQQEMARAGRVNLGVELRRIEAALARAEQGTYGICCRCAEPIEGDRLNADPAAPFCVPCVEELAEERAFEDRHHGRR